MGWYLKEKLIFHRPFPGMKSFEGNFFEIVGRKKSNTELLTWSILPKVIFKFFKFSLASKKKKFVISLGPVHTTLGEFENGGFTLKRNQMFSVHSTPKEFENATITGHFGFVFEENSVREIT